MTIFGMKKMEKKTYRQAALTRTAARARMMAWAMAAALALTALSTDGIIAHAAENAATAIKLTKSEGTVSILSSSDKKLAMADNMRLYNGYQVKTGEESYAWLELDGTKMAKVDAVSKTSLRKRGKKLEILLDAGNVFFNVTEPLKADESLNIRTATMVAGIRGTSGWVEVVDGKQVKLSILEGSVEVRVTDPVTNETKLERISSGETAICQVDGQAQEGEKCDIRREEMKQEDVKGFVLEAVAADAALAEKIYDKGGLDLREVTPEQAAAKIEAEVQEMHQKIVQVETAVKEQEAKSAPSLVWGGAPAQTQEPVVAQAPTVQPPAPQPPVIQQPVVQPPAPQPTPQPDPEPDDEPDPTPPPAPPSGTTGEVAWSFANGTLTISGTGQMDSYNQSMPGPWSAYAQDIKSIVVADGVTKIGGSSFIGCSNVKTVTIPQSVTSIGGSSFDGCTGLTDIYWSSPIFPMTQMSSLFAGNPVLHFSNEATDWKQTWTCKKNNAGLGKYHLTIKESMAQITDYTALGQQPWKDYNDKIETIEVKTNITAIGNYAFAGCTALMSIYIPQTVKKIGSQAFKDCGALAAIYFGGSEAEWTALVPNAQNAGIHTNPPMDYYVGSSGLGNGSQVSSGDAD